MMPLFQITAEKAAAEFDQSEFVRANREERRRLQAETRAICHLADELNAAQRNFSENCDDSVSQLRQAYANLSKKRESLSGLRRTANEPLSIGSARDSGATAHAV